ncbi:hypothetical protein ABCR94_08020 [Streptomyces sp. 21So2-11]
MTAVTARGCRRAGLRPWPAVLAVGAVRAAGLSPPTPYGPQGCSGA